MSDLYTDITSREMDRILAANRRLPPGYQVVPGSSFSGIEAVGYDMDAHYAGDGWKFHLSVTPEDLPRATDIVMEAVERHGVQAFKVANPDVAAEFDMPGNPQAGKQFTLYGARNDPNFRWDAVIRDIEIRFAEAGIRPSASSIQGDRMVPGSRYAGYRNELSHGQLREYANRDGYLGASDIRDAVADGRVQPGWEHNPTRQPDTLQDIDFSRDPDVLRAREAGARAPVLRATSALAQGQGVPNESLPELLDRKLNTPGAIERIGTNRGYSIMLRGTEAELARMHADLNRMGIDAVIEGPGSEFGNGIRVRSTSIEAAENLLRDAPAAAASARAQAVPATATVAPRTSNASFSVQADLREALGETNILNVERIDGGYRVEVPETYSRNSLRNAGINPEGLRRQNNGPTHTIDIPDERLPATMARDARVFAALDQAGISDVATSAYRTGTTGRTTGYVIEVPETFSRSNLANAGIDVASVTRENLGNGTHRITIPADTADPTLGAPARDDTIRNRLIARDGHARRADMSMDSKNFGRFRNSHAPLRFPAAAAETQGIARELSNSAPSLADIEAQGLADWEQRAIDNPEIAAAREERAGDKLFDRTGTRDRYGEPMLRPEDQRTRDLMRVQRDQGSPAETTNAALRDRDAINARNTLEAEMRANGLDPETPGDWDRWGTSASPRPAAPEVPDRPNLLSASQQRVHSAIANDPSGRVFDEIAARELPGGRVAAPVEPRPVGARPPRLPEVPTAPIAELEIPRGRITGGRLAGVAGVVLTAGMPVVEGLMDQRTDYGETRGEAIGRAYRHAPENLVRSVAAPVVSLSEGDVTMATAQTVQLVTMVDVPGWVNLMRNDAVARGIPQADVDRFMTALPPGNMNLGSRDPALNQIAQLIAYRNQGTTELLVGTNLFSAGVKIYGPGQQGMPVGEGTWVTRTDSLLDEQIRQYMANGGTATGIMEAINPEFHREQVFNRMRNVVPDRNTPGYTEYPIEYREGRELLERFRTGIQNGVDATPAGRAEMIGIANEYLRVKDFDETAALRSASYQYTRLAFNIPRPEQLVEAGMGAVFNITGRPENLAQDMQNITRVLNTEVGNGETILSTIRPGNDFAASPQDVMAALPPALRAQVRVPQPAASVPAVAAQPAPVSPPVEEVAVSEIVVTAPTREQRLLNAQEVSRPLGQQLQRAGLVSALDENGDGKVSRGELSNAITMATGESVDYSDVRNGLSQNLIQRLRDDQGIA